MQDVNVRQLRLSYAHSYLAGNVRQTGVVLVVKSAP